LGLNIVHVTGRGVQKGIVHVGRGGESYTVDMLPKVKVEVVVHDNAAERAIQIILKAAWTGNIGDGKIFVMPVEDAIRVRTGERGEVAL
jgi:nitrogen regulatory protein P-II 1